MKKLLITIALVLLATPCFAWTLQWNAVSDADGYRVTYNVLNDTNLVTIDTTTGTSVDLDALGLVAGTRYEFHVQCYVNNPPPVSYGCDSDYIRWTYPSEPIYVEMPIEERVLNIW